MFLPFMATKTLNIALDEQLLKQIDQAVKADFGSRSEYFRRLALADLERRNRWQRLIQAGEVVGNQMNFATEEEVFEYLTT